MSSVTIQGDRECQAMLRQWENPKLDKRLQTATKAGADVFKPAVKAEAGKVSKRLKRSVSVRRARKDRPATVLTFRPSVAWFRHLIIGGTRAHGPRKARLLVFVTADATVRTARVRGVRPNPIISRVARRLEAASYSAIDQSLDKEI